jgi:GH24 family phage-related lysozyme (muramidase)
MDIINEDLDIPTPAQHQPASNTIINSDFLKFVMNVENAELKGRDPKTKIWHPHSSPEGGSETVGYGHKLKNGPNVQKHTNLSDKDVVKLLRDDLVEANKKVHQYVEKVYGAKILLNQKQEEMLTEFAFNLGGLDKFPKFVDGVLRNDMNIMKKEFKRNYKTPAGERKTLDRRNQLFYDRFLK